MDTTWKYIYLLWTFLLIGACNRRPEYTLAGKRYKVPSIVLYMPDSVILTVGSPLVEEISSTTVQPKDTIDLGIHDSPNRAK